MMIPLGARSAFPMLIAPKTIVEWGIISTINSCIVGANLVCSVLSSFYSELAIFDTRQLYASVELIFDFLFSL
jgi:hypothetical protein